MSHHARRLRQLPLSVRLLLVSTALASPAHAQGDTDQAPRRIASLLDVVATEHISPPSQKDLLTSAIQQLAKTTKRDLGPWLWNAERLEGGDDAFELLKDLHAAVLDELDSDRIATELARGISQRLPGGAMTIDADTARVNDSLDGNRYVGVGVVLDFQSGRPLIRDTYFGGPAHRGGIEAGDVVYEVDGVDTAGMTPARFLEYSRDDVGTELIYVVGPAGSDERRTTRLIRGVVPRETVEGRERLPDEAWSFTLTDKTAYVKLTEINASTAHELRRAADRIRRSGLSKLVLDLRGSFGRKLHGATLVADLFVDDGVMGASATRHRRTQYRAGPDTLFDPRSVAVVIDERTVGPAEWLAGVLGREGAILIGEATAGAPFLRSRVTVPGWPGELSMATGWMLDPTQSGDSDESGPLRSVQPDRRVPYAQADDPRVEAARGVLDR